MPTRSLRSFAEPLRLDVQPLARLHFDGRLDLEGPAWPPEGDLLLVLWRPGEAPAFLAVVARVERDGAGWRAEALGAEGWVVLWIPPRGLGPRGGVFEGAPAHPGT